MAVPNMRAEVERLSIKFPQAWKDAHTGNAHTEDFIHLLAAHLHAIDPRFGLNGKRGNPHDLSDDALNFVGEGGGTTPDGRPCSVVDVIGGAGGPNPQPAWQVFSQPPEANGAWVRPGSAPQPDPDPPPHVCPELKIPDYEAFGGDSFGHAMIGVPLAADYVMAGQQLNAGSAAWFWRTCHSLMAALVKANGMPIDPTNIIKKHRNEWRTELGLPPLS